MHRSTLTSIRLITMTWLLIWSATLTIALETIICRWQCQPFFPIVNKERTPPMFFLSMCLLFSALLSFAVTLKLVQQHLRRDTPPRCQRTFGIFLWTLLLDLIGCYLRLGINSSRLLGRWWCQDLGLRKTLVFGHVHHIGGKRMLINLHSPLRSFKFQLPLLEGQFNLLSEDLAFICIMRCGIVPLVVFHILELFFRRDLVILLQFDQPFRQ